MFLSLKFVYLILFSFHFTLSNSNFTLTNSLINIDRWFTYLIQLFYKIKRDVTLRSFFVCKSRIPFQNNFCLLNLSCFNQPKRTLWHTKENKENTKNIFDYSDISNRFPLFVNKLKPNWNQQANSSIIKIKDSRHYVYIVRWQEFTQINKSNWTATTHTEAI